MKLFGWLGRKRRLVMFVAAEEMPPVLVERALAGKAAHPIVTAVRQILADELTDAMTTASDPKIQNSANELHHALGQVDLCAQLRVKLANLTAGKEDGSSE